MNKTTKITIIIISIATLLLVSYFFLPKKQTKCSALSDDCTTCTCTRGFPIIDALFQEMGGKSEPDCFLGKTINCKTESPTIQK